MQLDPSTPFGARVMRRMQDEQVIWLTTTGRDGTPQPNPVWFLWEDESFLIYTQPSSHKVRNIRRNPRVALHFNTDEDGDDVTVFTGTAILDENPTLAHHNRPYLEKYRRGISNIGETPEGMGQEYCLLIRVNPEKLRGF